MQELIEFMEVYTCFFEQVESKQEEKLNALLSGDIRKVEGAIVMQQALDKQIANMEQQRMETFMRLGIMEKTFRELVEENQGEDRKVLGSLFERLDKAIGNIRFLNKKAIKLAQDALSKTDSRDFARSGAGQMGNKYVQPGAGTGSVWNTKI